MNDETVFNPTDVVQYEIHPSIAAEAGIPANPVIQQVTAPVEAQLQQEQHSYSEQQERYLEDTEKNFKKLRSDKERLQRERDEAVRLLQQQQMSQQNYNQPQQNNNIPLEDDAFVEGKHLKDYYRRLEDQQEDIKKIQQQNQQIFLETKLRSELPDIGKVLSEENIETLSTLHPEIAQTISSSPDIYTKGKAAYQMIKTLGIYKEDKYENDRRRAQDNAYKPRPLSSVSPQQGESPLSHANAFANGLTDDLKKQLWKEMKQSASGRV